MRAVVLFCLMSVALIGGFSGMMNLKTQVLTMDRTRQNMFREQVQLKEDLKVLRAEYVRLARPERLRQFALQRGFQRLEMWQIQPFYKLGGVL